MPKNIAIRLAQNDDGPDIGRMFVDTHYPLDNADWGNVAGNWIVADREGEVVGALMFGATRPIGVLELLLTKPAIGKRTRERVVKMMLESGLVLLAGMNCDVAMGAVPNELLDYLTVLQNRGAVVTAHCSVVVKRLT